MSVRRSSTVTRCFGEETHAEGSVRGVFTIEDNADAVFVASYD